MSTPALRPPVETSHDHIVVLRGASWADFQRVLEMRGDRPVPRVTYLAGALELMRPSREHEHRKSTLGRLVEAWCIDRGLDLTPYGSWTLEKKEADRGVEPDECYVFGTDPEPEHPDLAIEVIWTSGGLNKLEVYRKLDVPEVWIWKGSAIRVFVLRGEDYVEAPASEALADLDLALLARFVEVTPMTAAVRAFRASLT